MILRHVLFSNFTLPQAPHGAFSISALPRGGDDRVEETEADELIHEHIIRYGGGGVG